MTPLKGLVRDEKLMEAWLMANSVKPEDKKAYKNITEIFGKFDFVANTIRSYYIKFMDIFGYEEKNGQREYKIIELKTEKATLEDLKQLIKYINWIAEFLAEKNLNRVEGFLVGKKFDIEIINQSDEKKLWDSIKLVEYYYKQNTFYLRIYNAPKQAKLF